MRRRTNHYGRRSYRRDRSRSRRVSHIVAFILSAALATFFDWELYSEAMRHRAKFGHMHVHQDLLVMAMITSGLALSAFLFTVGSFVCHPHRDDA